MYKYSIATFILWVSSFFYPQNIEERLQKSEDEIQKLKEENLLCFI